jgi:hypothetical protein
MVGGGFRRIRQTSSAMRNPTAKHSARRIMFAGSIRTKRLAYSRTVSHKAFKKGIDRDMAEFLYENDTVMMWLSGSTWLDHYRFSNNYRLGRYRAEVIQGGAQRGDE